MILSLDSGPSHFLSLLAKDDFHEKSLTFSHVDEASRAMEALQTELDRVHETRNTQYRRRCLKFMRHLNRVHGVLPTSMYLTGLLCESSTAVTGGGFADIWIGRLENRRVCVKVLRFFQRGTDRDKLLKDLGKEVLLWRQLKHPNILPFLGINTDLFSPSFCMISPWMTNGDIISYARESSLDIHTKLFLTAEVVEGIVYLHGLDPPVVHGDIKGANILISDDRHCCLADFGLSVLDTPSINPTHTATAQGSLRWLAPEFINPAPSPQLSQGKLTSRDIYAFGSTMFELLTGKPPFSHHILDISVAIDVLNGVRPVLSTDDVPNNTAFKAICEMLDSCWSEKIMERPHAETLLDSLHRVQYLCFPENYTGGSTLDYSSNPVRRTGERSRAMKRRGRSLRRDVLGDLYSSPQPPRPVNRDPELDEPINLEQRNSSDPSGSHFLSGESRRSGRLKRKRETLSNRHAKVTSSLNISSDNEESRPSKVPRVQEDNQHGFDPVEDEPSRFPTSYTEVEVDGTDRANVSLRNKSSRFESIRNPAEPEHRMEDSFQEGSSGEGALAKLADTLSVYNHDAQWQSSLLAVRDETHSQYKPDVRLETSLLQLALHSDRVRKPLARKSSTPAKMKGQKKTKSMSMSAGRGIKRKRASAVLTPGYSHSSPDEQEIPHETLIPGGLLWDDTLLRQAWTNYRSRSQASS